MSLVPQPLEPLGQSQGAEIFNPNRVCLLNECRAPAHALGTAEPLARKTCHDRHDDESLHEEGPAHDAPQHRYHGPH